VFGLNLFAVLTLALWGPTFAPAVFADTLGAAGPVQDEAKILSPGTVGRLDGLLRDLWSTRKIQIQVLTIATLNGEPIEQYSMRAAEKLRLGSAKEDQGLLFLIAVKDRKMRIEVGQGLEGEIPDVIAKRIIEDEVAPYFKQGQFDAGVTEGVYSIVRRAAPDFLGDSNLKNSRRRGNGSSRSAGELIIFFLVAFVIVFLNGRRVGRGFFGGGGFGGGSWSGGGSGLGGGGWSGGGGGFSGGGASGGW
jgi:uncharacterized protein